ncbi:MAG TPA: hypothetical protein VK633_01570 [Verrucomicrobiae bacterium]|nr:hypothetical protein [Verrucomicrobiae bacterium]
MEFIVTDREGIEAGVLVRSSYIVISIHDPDNRPARVRQQPGLRGVLVLSFDDAEEIPGTAQPDEIKLMTSEHAKEIWRFVEKHRAEVGTVVVHCEGGVSRSPAVAAALCQSLGGDAGRFWQEYQPNQHVFHLMLQAFAASSSEDSR